MIPNKCLITIVLLLLLGLTAFSQPICGFDIVHKRKMNADPIYRQHVLANEAAIRQYILQHPLLKQPVGTNPPGQTIPREKPPQRD